jgi:hypothetical protein
MKYAERQRRLDRARQRIQAELLIGLTVVILTGYFAGGAFPMFYVPPVVNLLLLAAPVVALLAWVWMLRLSRPRPEAGEPSWRYRDRAA